MNDMETKSRYDKREFRALMKRYGYTESKDLYNIPNKTFYSQGRIGGWMVQICDSLFVWAEDKFNEDIGLGRYGYIIDGEQTGLNYGKWFYEDFIKTLELQKNGATDEELCKIWN